MEKSNAKKRSCTLPDSPAIKRINNQNGIQSPVLKTRCFMCYKPTEDNKCSTCHRHFHLKCLNSSGLRVDWKCYACLRLKPVPHPSQIEYNLPDMLEIFVQMLKFDERLLKLQPLRADDVLELNELFDEKIKKRIEQLQYESLGQFFNSMENLLYDIVTKLDDKKLVPLGRLKEWANSVVGHCADEIDLIESCSKCFVSKSKDPINWFTSVCDSRHKVVWAKIQQTYWPAKVLKEEEKWFTVQFFDGHIIDKINHKNIINYSDDDPNEAMAEEDYHCLKNSLEDVKRYLEKLDRGTSPSDFSNELKIVFNRFTNSRKASEQSFLRHIQSMTKAEMNNLQKQLQQMTEEKDRLSQFADQNIQLTADKTRLIAENNQLAAHKAQLIVEISEMEANNEKLTEKLIKAEIVKKELFEKIEKEKINSEYVADLERRFVCQSIRLLECQALNNQLSAKLAAKDKEDKNKRQELQQSIIELFNEKKN